MAENPRNYDVLFEEYKNEELARIKLTEGKFKDTIFYYSYVSIDELEDDQARLNFHYEVVETPVSKLIKKNKEEFEAELFEVLISIIEDKALYEHGENYSD